MACMFRSRCRRDVVSCRHPRQRSTGRGSGCKSDHRDRRSFDDDAQSCPDPCLCTQGKCVLVAAFSFPLQAFFLRCRCLADTERMISLPRPFGGIGAFA